MSVCISYLPGRNCTWAARGGNVNVDVSSDCDSDAATQCNQREGSNCCRCGDATHRTLQQAKISHSPFPLPQAPQHCFQVFTPAWVAPLLPPISTCPILFPQRIPHAQRETLCGCSLCVGERRNGNILVFGGRKKEVDNTSVLVASCHPLKRRRHFWALPTTATTTTTSPTQCNEKGTAIATERKRESATEREREQPTSSGCLWLLLSSGNGNLLQCYERARAQRARQRERVRREGTGGEQREKVQQRGSRREADRQATGSRREERELGRGPRRRRE